MEHMQLIQELTAERDALRDRLDKGIRVRVDRKNNMAMLAIGNNATLIFDEGVNLDA